MIRKQLAIMLYWLGLGSLALGIIGALGYSTFSPLAAILIWFFFQEISRLMMALLEAEEDSEE